MSVVFLERPSPIETSGGSDLMHIVCEFCWKNFCDGDMCPDDQLEPYAEYPNDCLVCEDLDDALADCPHCGVGLADTT